MMLVTGAELQILLGTSSWYFHFCSNAHSFLHNPNDFAALWKFPFPDVFGTEINDYRLRTGRNIRN